MAPMKPNIIYEDRYRSIIARLAKARQDAGLTQAELAEKLGLNQPEISRIEKLDRQIDLLEFLDWIQATNDKDLATVLATLEGASNA